MLAIGNECGTADPPSNANAKSRNGFVAEKTDA
jgi:hypothetical protein